MMAKIPRAYILGALALIALVAAAFTLIHLPLAADIQNKRGEYNEKAANLRNVKLKVQKLAELRREMQQLQENLEVLQNKIPEKPDIPGVVKLLERFGKESGAIIGSVSFENNQPAGANPANNATQAGAANNGAIATGVCQVKLKGSYASIIKFIRALKDSPRLFGVKNVSFNAAGDDGRELDVSLALAFFHYNAPSPENRISNK